MSKTATIKFIDLFAGCGGLSLGLMQAGYTGLFAVEKDENAFETLKHNLLSSANQLCFDWPEWLAQSAHCIDEVLVNHQLDLERLRGEVDLVVGGPPCQGFSSAGKRNPSDPRNQLVRQYFQFIELIRPRAIVIENVKGMASDFKDTSDPSGKRNYANWILSYLQQDYNVFHKLIDVSDFGVPQKRLRLFIVGIRKDVSSSNANPLSILPDLRDEFLRDKGIAGTPISTTAAISDLEIRRNGTRESRDTKGFQEIAYKAPRTSFQKLLHEGSGANISDTRIARHKSHIEDRFKKIISKCHAEGRLNVSLSPEYKASLGLKKSAIRVLDPDSPAPTITSMPDDLIHYSEPRTLTVRENARLQSFPDWFEFKGKYTSGGLRRRTEVPRFTQVANAVPPLIAEALGKAILVILSEADVMETTAKAPPVPHETQAA